MSIVRENISFERGLDVKAALGVGKKAQIEKWFEDIEDKIDRKLDYIDYIINDDLSIIVNGDLYLRDIDINKLPDNLTIYGYLDLRDTNITTLPNNLNVKRYLDLEDTMVAVLPHGLNIDGFIDIRGTKVTELPPDLNVKGNIYKDF